MWFISTNRNQYLILPDSTSKCTIGRGNHNDIVDNDVNFSSSHGEFTFDSKGDRNKINGSIIYTDYSKYGCVIASKSSNGTTLKEDKLIKKASRDHVVKELTHGTIISFPIMKKKDYLKINAKKLTFCTSGLNKEEIDRMQDLLSQFSQKGHLVPIQTKDIKEASILVTQEAKRNNVKFLVALTSNIPIVTLSWLGILLNTLNEYKNDVHNKQSSCIIAPSIHDCYPPPENNDSNNDNSDKQLYIRQKLLSHLVIFLISVESSHVKDYGIIMQNCGANVHILDMSLIESSTSKTRSRRSKAKTTIDDTSLSFDEESYKIFHSKLVEAQSLVKKEKRKICVIPLGYQNDNHEHMDFQSMQKRYYSACIHLCKEHELGMMDIINLTDKVFNASNLDVLTPEHFSISMPDELPELYTKLSEETSGNRKSASRGTKTDNDKDKDSDNGKAIKDEELPSSTQQENVVEVDATPVPELSKVSGASGRSTRASARASARTATRPTKTTASTPVTTDVTGSVRASKRKAKEAATVIDTTKSKGKSKEVEQKDDKDKDNNTNSQKVAMDLALEEEIDNDDDEEGYAVDEAVPVGKQQKNAEDIGSKATATATTATVFSFDLPPSQNQTQIIDQDQDTVADTDTVVDIDDIPSNDKEDIAITATTTTTTTAAVAVTDRIYEGCEGKTLKKSTSPVNPNPKENKKHDNADTQITIVTLNQPSPNKENNEGKLFSDKVVEMEVDAPPPPPVEQKSVEHDPNEWILSGAPVTIPPAAPTLLSSPSMEEWEVAGERTLPIRRKDSSDEEDRRPKVRWITLDDGWEVRVEAEEDEDEVRKRAESVNPTSNSSSSSSSSSRSNSTANQSVGLKQTFKKRYRIPPNPADIPTFVNCLPTESENMIQRKMRREEEERRREVYEDLMDDEVVPSKPKKSRSRSRH